jgi:Leucine-rich repeat (LRR) protein
LLILFIANVLQAAPVNIPDSNLKAAIEDELGIANPDAWDMLLLTYLSADSNNISDLTGLESAANLVYLSLSYNFISDLTALSGLTNLEQLRLRHNNINDISALAALTNLKHLFVSYNYDITDINVISNMKNLIEVGLTDVNIVNISPLEDVNQIQVLWLGYNPVENINALRNYKNLTLLNLHHNPLNCDSRCSYLQEIVNNNPDATITPTPGNDINTFSTNWLDLRIFVDWWLNGTCGLTNGYCQCADLNDSGEVNFEDFAVFADLWMAQP